MKNAFGRTKRQVVHRRPFVGGLLRVTGNPMGAKDLTCTAATEGEEEQVAVEEAPTLHKEEEVRCLLPPVSMRQDFTLTVTL